jgi:3-hydroxyisobutyrate dehydrogenase-like beta-hydroxyacid dehydrogenase
VAPAYRNERPLIYAPPMSVSVAFLGLGTMGSRQAAVLARAGFDLTVYNRTFERARAWSEGHGGRAATSPADAARGAAVVITMVVDGPQVEELLLGPEGAVRTAAAGTLFVDMSTIAPGDARRIGARLAEHGHAFLDAPVSGSAAKAADGTLTIMAGGEPADLERAQPLLEAMGEKVIHAGPLGHGQTIKLIHNAVAAVNLAALAQAMVMGDRAGVDLDALMAVLAAGAAGSTMLDRKGNAMRRHDFTPLFKLDHMLKDLRFCLDEAARSRVPFPLATSAADSYTAASAHGFGQQDFAAVLEAAESLANHRVA